MHTVHSDRARQLHAKHSSCFFSILRYRHFPVARDPRLIGPSRKAIRVRVGAPLQQTKEDDPATLMARAAQAVDGLQSDLAS